MKKTVILILIICVLMLSGCEKNTGKRCYDYDYAIAVTPNGIAQVINIEQYIIEGNTIQITDEHGKIYLFHLSDVVLIKEKHK